jgi:hypothetical protein
MGILPMILQSGRSFQLRDSSLLFHTPIASFLSAASLFGFIHPFRISDCGFNVGGASRFALVTLWLHPMSFGFRTSCFGFPALNVVKAQEKWPKWPGFGRPETTSPWWQLLYQL